MKRCPARLILHFKEFALPETLYEWCSDFGRRWTDCAHSVRIGVWFGTAERTGMRCALELGTIDVRALDLNRHTYISDRKNEDVPALD
jgi:hypothetical protein